MYETGRLKEIYSGLLASSGAVVSCSSCAGGGVASFHVFTMYMHMRGVAVMHDVVPFAHT